MSTSKKFDRIVKVIMALALVVTILFMNGSSLGLASAERTMGYENRLFSNDRVHTIDIVADNWDSFIETCENEEYINVTVVIDGEKYSNIGLRAKGNTSLSNVSAMGSQRYSFKLEFDQYQSGKTYYGLDKLCLNNLIQDNTMMKDYLVYTMMDEFGVDSPLCSYVYITVNGQDWGLYLAVEGVEDGFLERNYGSDSGDLYKPDSLSFGGGRGNGQGFDMNQFDFTGEGESSETTGSSENSGPTRPENGGSNESSSSGNNSSGSNESSSFGNMGGGFSFGGGGNGSMPDMSNIPSSGDFDVSNINIGNMMGGFGMGSDDVKLKYIDDDPDSYSNIFNNAKTDVTKSDQKRLINSLKNLTEYTNLEETVNIDEVLRYFVVHNFVINGDSYTGSMIHNYYLHENDGMLEMIPWDYNLAFGTFTAGDASQYVNADIDNPVSGDVNERPMVGWIFSSDEYIDQYHELFSAFVEEWITSGKLNQLIEDTAEMIRPYVESDPTRFCTVEEFETGVETISEYCSLRGEAVTRQLNGDDTPVETNGLNTSAMGSMSGTGTTGGGDFGFGGFGGGDRPDTPSERPSESAGADGVSGATTEETTAAVEESTESSSFGNGSDSFGGTAPNGTPGGAMPEGTAMPEGFTGGSMPAGSIPGESFAAAETTAAAQTTETVGETQASTSPSAGGFSMPGGGSFDASSFDSSSFPGMDGGVTRIKNLALVGASAVTLLAALIFVRKYKY